MLKSWTHCLTVSMLLFWPAVVQSEEQSIDLGDLTQVQTPILPGVDEFGQPQVIHDIEDQSGGTKITLSDQPTHKIPKLYGMMYEDINVSSTISHSNQFLGVSLQFLFKFS